MLRANVHFSITPVERIEELLQLPLRKTALSPHDAWAM
jgi:hypothetical protein